jgi:hypothetical protein
VDRADGSDPEDAAAQYLLGLRCTAFGLAHDPWFSLPSCLPKGLAYLVDTLRFGGEALFRWRAGQLERSE